VRRLALILLLLVVWAAFGFGVNRFLESRKSNLTEARSTLAPPQESPAFSLPGVIYVSQAGHLYRFDAGKFTDLKLPAATGAWMEPSPASGGHLLAVARAADYSDVYLVDGTTGTVVQKLTSNATRTKFVELNAWSYFPHLATDGKTVVFNYDGPKTGTSYEVDFAVWAGPLGGKLATTQWTTPNGYTGGDVAPVPLPGGGVLYAKYALDSSSKVLSRIAMVARPGATPVYLTAAADDCNEPAVSPDGTQLAVVCTSDTQTAKLELIPLVKGVPGTPKVLVDACLCASPSWSPDGGSLLYLAPADATGHFQLWWLNHATAVTPAPANLVTTHLDLDATSPPAWVAA
jgi:Tol biopolymer transport system component